MRGEKHIDIYKVHNGEGAPASDMVAVEEPLALYVNDRKVVTLLYTPPMAMELALGYLFSEGLINSRDDVRSLSLRKGRVVIDIKGKVPEDYAGGTVTSGCGGGLVAAYPEALKKIKKVKSRVSISRSKVFELADSFRKMSALFEETGGVHSAALSDGSGIIQFADDVGRHNAADKVFGSCLLKGIEAAGKLLLTTGRVSSEIVLKCARSGVPIIISRSAPTSLAVELAERFGITLAGFVRGKRMNVYTKPERIIP
jgi:FdhD protein